MSRLCLLVSIFFSKIYDDHTTLLPFVWTLKGNFFVRTYLNSEFIVWQVDKSDTTSISKCNKLHTGFCPSSNHRQCAMMSKTWKNSIVLLISTSIFCLPLLWHAYSILYKHLHKEYRSFTLTWSLQLELDHRQDHKVQIVQIFFYLFDEGRKVETGEKGRCILFLEGIVVVPSATKSCNNDGDPCVICTHEKNNVSWHCHFLCISVSYLLSTQYIVYYLQDYLFYYAMLNASAIVCCFSFILFYWKSWN